MKSLRHSLLLALLAWLLLAPGAEAARVSDAVDIGAFDLVKETIVALGDWGADRDRSLDGRRWAVLGLILLGINCSVLGSFVVVRKVALIGDMIAHAVLPGVAIGFLWTMEKDPVRIVLCAVGVGMIATLLMQAIKRTTRIKQDAALAIVLGSFYAVGVCLMKRIEKLEGVDKSALDSFWMGNAATLGWPDVRLMLLTTLATLVVLSLFYKTLLASGFDREFTISLGLPVLWIERLLMLLTTFAIVVAMQAVGVVLVAAMLIIPASTAFLLTNRMSGMLWISAVVGAFSGVVGFLLSLMGKGFSTGPFLVLTAGLCFAIAFLFASREGWVTRWVRQRSRHSRIERENTLKAMYRVLEDTGFSTETVDLEKVAERRREGLAEVQLRVKNLVSSGEATLNGKVAFLTPEGYETACKVVRNHRLWELYLTQVANYEADHVHDDAEEIEHVLGEATVRRLERDLAFPNKDPHGQPIPSLRDLMGKGPGHATGREQHGYG